MGLVRLGDDRIGRLGLRKMGCIPLAQATEKSGDDLGSGLDRCGRVGRLAL